MNHHTDPTRRQRVLSGETMCVCLLTVKCGTHGSHKVWMVCEDGNASWLLADVLVDVLGPREVEATLFMADHTFRPWGPRLLGGVRG